MITDWQEDHERGITHPEGFAAGTVRCGLKTEGDDLALIVSDRPATAAGVFTTNQVKASCVTFSQSVLANGTARAILCNAGNANACNGERGLSDTERSAQMVSARLELHEGDVLIASTGIIGHPLPMNKLEDGIPGVAADLERSAVRDMEVARAIMTTDTRPKLIAATCKSDAWSGGIRIGGVCKGSGMIAPNMATMLCFLTTDAAVPTPLLQKALNHAVARTFNRITVDGDTSTNDMTLLLANGAGTAQIHTEGPAYDDFCEALERVCRHLAKEVARDGEGATKLVEVAVKGARSENDAERIARTIAESPLVKTALFGCDPNWGRIMMAAGRAGVAFDPALGEVRLGDLTVFRAGMGVTFDPKEASAYLSKREVRLVLDLHAGSAEATVWTCDLSYDYVRINAEYHT